LLLPLHVSGDVVRGFDFGGLGLLTVVFILIVLVCGTLLRKRSAEQLVSKVVDI